MQSQQKHGKLLTVKDGYLVCPYCRRNRKVKRIDAAEYGERILVYCRECRREFRIDIDEGQSFESRSQ